MAKVKSSSKPNANGKPRTNGKPGASKVKPVPEGMHTVTPHLTVKGAAAAIEFYKKAFGAQELCSLPAGDGKIVHAEIQIGDSRVMLNDEFPDMGCGATLSPLSHKGTSVCLNLCVENADAVFKKALKAGAKEVMPLADMFWGDRYGQVEDPFGHRWSIMHHIEDVPPEEIARRATTMFGNA